MDDANVRLDSTLEVRSTSCAARSRSSMPRERASSPRPTRSAAGSSATSTTAPSSTSSRSPSTSSWRGSSPTPIRRGEGAARRRSGRDVEDALESCVSWRTGSTRRSCSTAGSPEALRAAAARAGHPDTRRGRRARPLSPRGRGDGVLLLPRGAAERGQACRARTLSATVRAWREQGALLFEVRRRRRRVRSGARAAAAPV